MPRRIQELKKNKQELENKIQRFCELYENRQFNNINDLDEATSLLNNNIITAKQKASLYIFIVFFYESGFIKNNDAKGLINILTDFVKFSNSNLSVITNKKFYDYVLLRLVEVMLQRGDNNVNHVTLAKDCLDKIQNKNTSMYYRNKGVYLKCTNQYQEALKFYKLSISKEIGLDSGIRPYLDMVNICIKLKINNEAKEYLVKAKEYISRNSTIRESDNNELSSLSSFEACILVSEHKLNQASNILDTIPLEFQDEYYNFIRGDICKILGDHDNSIEYFSKSISIKYSIVTKYNLASSYAYKQDLKNFTKLFSEIMKNIDSSNDGLLPQEIIGIKASLHCVAGNSELAMDLVNSSLDDIDLLLLRLQLLYDTKKYQEAADLAFSLLERYKDNPQLYDWVGKFYIENNQLDLANSYIEKSLKLNEFQIGTRVNLANIHMLKGEYQAALKLYQEERNLFKIQKDNIRILSNIAKAYYELSDFEQSLQFINQAIEYNKHNIHLYNHKGLILAKQNKIEGAKEAFRAAVEIDPTISSITNRYIKKLSNSISETNVMQLTAEIDNAKIDQEVIANQNEANSIIMDAKKLSEFKLYKTLTEIEEARRKLKAGTLSTKSNAQSLKGEKIWGENNPAFGKDEVKPLVWGNITHEQTKCFSHLTDDIKEQLTADTLKSAIEILKAGKLTTRDRGQQGVKFYSKNCIKIKMLGYDGDVRIVGRRIKDQETGCSLFVFDQLERKHSKTNAR